MRKLAGLVLLVALLTSCNRSTQKKIGVVAKGRAHIFWQSVHAGAVKAGREANVEIVWNSTASESDFNGQLQIVDSMITQHLDAICLAPIDKKVMVNIVEKATAAGIPVVIWDSPVDTDKFVAQVATDNYAAGEMAAERMGQILGGKGQVAELAVQVGVGSTMLRESGFEDLIKKKYPAIKIVDKRYGNADFAESLKVAENMLTAFPEMAGMFASNESGSVGAAQALKSRKSTVKLVGFDSSKSLVDGIKEGLIDSLVTQDPFDMGYKAVKAALEKMNGGTPQRIQNLPPVIVSKANIDDPAVQSRLFPDLDKYLK